MEIPQRCQFKGEASTCATKQKTFRMEMKISFKGKTRAKAEYASKRANGTINTHPQERMRASGAREDGEYDE